MSAVMVSLLPLIFGAALGGPAWIIMALILLRGEHGVIKAAAFAAGALVVRVVQFILFGYAFRVAVDTEGDVDLIPPTLLLVAGLLLMITAIKVWWRADEDPDAPPPRWMTMLGGISAFTAFGMAVLMMTVATKQWVFTLSAIAVIDHAHLGTARTVLAYLFFILAAQSLMLAPIIGSAVSPAQSAKILAVTLRWLERKKRVITIAISLLLGAWFLTRATNGLLAHGEAPITKISTTN